MRISHVAPTRNQKLLLATMMIEICTGPRAYDTSLAALFVSQGGVGCAISSRGRGVTLRYRVQDFGLGLWSLGV